MNIGDGIRRVKEKLYGNIDFHDIDIQGSHIIYIYNDREKYIQNAVDFISEGLDEKNQILLVEKKDIYTSIIFQLVKLGYSEEDIGSINYHTTNDFYFATEEFNGETNIKRLELIFEESFKQGKSIRSWGHMVVDQSSICTVRNYESECDKIIYGKNTISVCAYNGMTTPAFFQNELLKVHEFVMVDDDLVKSNFYHRKHIELTPPERERLLNLERENNELKENNEKLLLHSATHLEREKSLEMEKLNAEKSNYEKSMFLSQMSHDLRTPLNTIQGYAQILMMNQELNTDLLYKTKKIYDSSEQLLKLIEEILDFASLDMGRVKVNKEKVYLEDFLTDCVETVKETNISDIHIHLGEIKSDTIIEADPVRLHQIMMNLLDNALKYNSPEGEIKIYCEETEEEVKILVEDSGYGIVEKDLDLIFEPFFRSQSTMERWRGTGLGLAIVAQLTSRMGGRYGVKSEKGLGSIFWTSFNKVKVTNSPSPSKFYPRKEEVGLIQPLRVLYIEDHHDNVEVMKSLLQQISKVDLEYALTGRDGIKKCSETLPHLIFLDLGLPDMTGFEILTVLESNPMTKNIPVVVVSADAMETTIDHAYEKGVFEYITKPININKLKNVLSKISMDNSLITLPSIN